MRPLGDGDQARQGHGARESKSALTDLQLCSAAWTQAPRPPAACATSGWTRPFTHMMSEPVMLPPPSRREYRMRSRGCVELHCAPCAARPGCPGIVAPQHPSAHYLRRAGGSCVRALPSSSVLPIQPDPTSVGRALPWDAMMLPSSRDSHGRRHSGRIRNQASIQQVRAGCRSPSNL
jgi:hypothetical protein